MHSGKVEATKEASFSHCTVSMSMVYRLPPATNTQGKKKRKKQDVRKATFLTMTPYVTRAFPTRSSSCALVCGFLLFFPPSPFPARDHTFPKSTPIPLLAVVFGFFPLFFFLFCFLSLLRLLLLFLVLSGHLFFIVAVVSLFFSLFFSFFFSLGSALGVPICCPSWKLSHTAGDSQAAEAVVSLVLGYPFFDPTWRLSTWGVAAAAAAALAVSERERKEEEEKLVRTRP